MFNLLIFIGFALIIWGLYMDKAPQEVSNFNDLSYRIELIENLLYNNEPILEDEYPAFEEEVTTFKDVMEDTRNQIIKKDVDLPTNIMEASEVISLYEEGKYTIEEVCSILNMKKGEVLLLKNLYKKYQE